MTNSQCFKFQVEKIVEIWQLQTENLELFLEEYEHSYLLYNKKSNI